MEKENEDIICLKCFAKNAYTRTNCWKCGNILYTNQKDLNYNETYNNKSDIKEKSKSDNKDNNSVLFTNLNSIVSGMSLFIAAFSDFIVFQSDFPITMILMIYGLIWAYLSRYIGLKKNIYSGYIWGYFLGIIGFIVICALPGEKEIVNESTQLLSNIEQIKKYKELLDIGAITEEEYNDKKKELLK